MIDVVLTKNETLTDDCSLCYPNNIDDANVDLYCEKCPTGSFYDKPDRKEIPKKSVEWFKAKIQEIQLELERIE